MLSVKPKQRKTSALLAAAVAATFALTACSAGQVTQTDQKVPAVPGTNAQVVGEDTGSVVELRDMLVAYNGIEGYEAGSDAPLQIRIFNSGGTADRLIGVSADGYAEMVTIVDESAPAPSQEQPESPTPDPDQPEGEDQSDDGTEPGEDTASEDTASTPPADAQPQPEPIALDLPIDGYLLLTPDEGVFLQLTGLTGPLDTGSIIQVTFTFELAGTITVDIPMALPTSADLPDREIIEFDGEGH